MAAFTQTERQLHPTGVATNLVPLYPRSQRHDSVRTTRVNNRALALMKSVLEDYVCKANDCIELKLVRQESDVFDDSKGFQPEFTHQLFGQNENIFGYKGLKIQLFYTSCKLKVYLNKVCTSEVKKNMFDGVEADNVLKVIADILEIPVMDNLDKFILQLPDEADFTPTGTHLHTYSREAGGVTTHYEVYKNTIDVPGFREYHKRMQTFLWWYIDAASYIDNDDDRWNYFTLFERYMVDGRKHYAFVGYGTVYNYWAYPNRIRPRISQVLVLPPYQKLGHGAEFLEAMYRDFRANPDVLDITVEDPSEEFVRLRDFIDCKNCMGLPAFSKDKLPQGFNDDMVKEALDKFKTNKKQVRRVYEILRLRVTDVSDSEQLKSYRLDVKQRLNIPFQKEKSDHEKLKKVLKPEELTAAMEGSSLQERQDKLETWYQDLVTDYRRILDRLAMC